MDTVATLSENIKHLADRHGLSIRQLAERVGVPASTLTDSLKSKRGLSIDTALKIASYFDCTVELLAKLPISKWEHPLEQRDQAAPPLPEALLVHLKKYETLSASSRHTVDDLMNNLLEIEHRASVVSVPESVTYTLAAHGGEGIETKQLSKEDYDKAIALFNRLKGTNEMVK